MTYPRKKNSTPFIKNRSLHSRELQAESLSPLPWPTFTFGTLWNSFFGQTLPDYTKRKYLPNPKAREKPFNHQDVRFFSSGVEELSELFTEERSDLRKTSDYFTQPKYRSSYLLYFAQLQAAKFYQLFTLHTNVIRDLVSWANTEKKVRIFDVGSGPATASLATVCKILENPELSENVLFEIHLNDQNSASLEDGKSLLESLLKNHPKNPQLKVFIHSQNLLNSGFQKTIINIGTCDLVLCGNLLNELNPGKHDPLIKELLEPLLQNSRFGLIMLEPAAKPTAQWLSEIRNYLLGVSPGMEHSQDKDTKNYGVVGPCLHQEVCPLSLGKDWCHQSLPVRVPGVFFQKFSMVLGSKRDWLKFSYLWLWPHAIAKQSPAKTWLILSEPLDREKKRVLVCVPNRPKTQFLNLNRPEHGLRGRRAVLAGSNSSRPHRPKEAVIRMVSNPRPANRRGPKT